MTPSLSVIIITKNAAEDIDRCLKSLQWADEIIVVDSGSTDNTVVECQKYTPHVFITDWPGFGPQKNRALSKASCEWVLSIDADEWLSSELATEIQKTLSNPLHSAYEIPRRSKFCGRWMHYGAWRNDWVLRLFRRGEAQFSKDRVHEKIIFSGSVGQLRHPLLHEPFKSLEEVINKMNHYSSSSAEQRALKKQSSSVLKALWHGIWTFCKCYFLKAGFLDGREGFILAVSNAEGSYYRYLKLYYLSKSSRSF